MLTELLRLDTPHGLLLAVALPSDDLARRALVDTLLPAERAAAERFAERRLLTWAGGRYVLRHAMALAGCPSTDPILSSPRGAPLVPGAVRASVSHKDEIACALVSRRAEGFIGVDVELAEAVGPEHAARILTDAERAEWSRLPASRQRLDLTARWSVKEAIYKAVDPYVQRFVGYHEAEVWLGEDGTARATMVLEDGGRFAVEATWLGHGAWVLATARVTRG